MLRNTHILAVLLCLGLIGCKTDNLFQDSTAAYHQPTCGISPQVIQTDDKLSLSIWNHDDLSVGSLFGIYNSNEVYGKWVMVNGDGAATFPKIGSVELRGLTIDQAEDLLTQELSAYLVEPIVVLRIHNRAVHILGEVNTPGSYPLEKSTNYLSEYLAMAGGLATYADISQIELIRTCDSVTTKYVLDLRAESSLNRTHLQNGDLIHVPSKSSKVFERKAPSLVPLTAVATTLAVIFSISR